MLEIIIAGVNVDLDKDIQLAFTIENPLMLEDRIPAPYSLNFEIPPTSKNLQAFGFPNRLGSYGINEDESKNNKPASIRFQSMEILKGHVIFLQYFKNIKLQFIGIDYNEHLKGPMYSLELGRQYFEGSYHTVDYEDSNNFAAAYLAWAAWISDGIRGDVIAAPISIVNTNISFTRYVESQKDYGGFQSSTGWFLDKAPYAVQDNEYINLYNPYRQTFILKPEDDLGRNRIVDRSHASIFPQFRVGFLFDVIFGGLLSENPFTENELYHLVMPTFYFPTWRKRGLRDIPWDTPSGVNFNNDYPPMVSNPRPSPDAPYPSTPYIELKDFMPDVDSNTFIKSLLNLFCMTMAVKSGKLIIRSNDSILAGSVSKDWTSKIASELDFKVQRKKLYVYGFENRKKEDISSNTIIEVPSLAAVMDHPYTLDATGYYQGEFRFEDRTIVKSVQQTEVKHVNGPVSETQFSYGYVDDGFNFAVEKENNDVFDMTSSVVPLPVYPATFFRNIDSDSEMKQWQVPGIKDLDREKRPTDIYLLYHNGDRLVGGNNSLKYPYLSANYEASTFSPRTLTWDGQYGLYNVYHKKFSQWIEKNKIAVNTTILLNTIDLKNLDILEKVHIQGRNFFIQKLQFTITLNAISPCLADLVEA